MSSYRCFFEFREIHYSIAWRSLYGFRYQSCWLQFLFFLGKPWENHFISLCSYPSSLMVVGNGIELHHMRGRVKLLQVRDRPIYSKFLSFLHRRKLYSWSPTPPACRVAALTEEGSAAGTWMKDEVPWYPEQDRRRKKPANHTPGLGKDLIFIPERALCLDKLRRTANFPGSRRIFSVHVRMNLQPHGEQRELWHQICHSYDSWGVWFHSYSCLQMRFGLFPNCSWLGILCFISWLSDPLRFWK